MMILADTVHLSVSLTMPIDAPGMMLYRRCVILASSLCCQGDHNSKAFTLSRGY